MPLRTNVMSQFAKGGDNPRNCWDGDTDFFCEDRHRVDSGLDKPKEFLNPLVNLNGLLVTHEQSVFIDG